MPEVIYASQRSRHGIDVGPCVPPSAAPQQPTILAPVRPTGPCPHLWALDGGLLHCYHCGWTYRAILARAQAGGSHV